MEKKINRENKCPQCNEGYISNRWDNRRKKWIETCTDCDFSNIHLGRRATNAIIKFPDRRKRR